MSTSALAYIIYKISLLDQSELFSEVNEQPVLDTNFQISVCPVAQEKPHLAPKVRWQLMKPSLEAEQLMSPSPRLPDQPHGGGAARSQLLALLGLL